MLYAGMADLGYDYGPVFQGVRAVWRAGEDVYAEVALPDDGDGAGFGIHPALFDAAMHGGLLRQGSEVSAVLPFSWSGVRLGAQGLSRVRARISPADDSALRVEIYGEQGEPVLSMDKLVFRPVEQGQLENTRGNQQKSLFELDWAPVAVGSPGPVRLAVLGGLAASGERYADLDALERALAEGAAAPDAVLAGAGVPEGADGVAEAAHEVAAGALELVRRWLASEWLG
ncbi:polyketide synthase dehydratase domain-containing protein, partial [Streptomyces sp. B1866]|uniref:polyketide synthase dehydratase domain-containing protein n=1 Tax=Streptomyces sp. B1866 TaxID=3075431 RepID=UPI00288D33A4